MLGKHHPRIESFRRAFQRSSSKSESLFPIEGPRMIAEAVNQSVEIVDALVTPELPRKKEGRALMARLRQRGVEPAVVSGHLVHSLSDLRTPQGIIALCRKRIWTAEDLQVDSGRPVLALCGVQDPGNLGTILRTSDAARAAGVVTLRGSASLYNLKVVRSTMGSIFRLPVLESYSVSQLLDLSERLGRRLIATVSAEGEDYRKVNYTERSLLLLGSEGAGIPAELIKRSHQRIHIPIHPRVESLNVAVAAAILLFAQAQADGGEKPDR